MITIDKGNSSTKVCLHQNGNMIWVHNDFKEFLKNTSVPVIYCSVNGVPEEISENKQAVSALSFFKESRLKDMPVHYSDTVGIDRLVTAYEIFRNYIDGEEIHVVIDVGTFTTVDWVCSKGFQGGFILPGPGLLKSTYQKGEQLFEVNPELKEQLPSTSKDAIAAGLYHTITAPIEKTLANFSHHKIHLTGGARHYLNQIRSEVPIVESEFLIHLGLRSLLL